MSPWIADYRDDISGAHVRRHPEPTPVRDMAVRERLALKRNASQPDSEIAGIERELATLRQRRASAERIGLACLPFGGDFILWVVALGAALAFVHPTLPGVLAGSVLLALVGLSCWIGYRHFILAAIAEREAHLATLKGAQ